MLQRTHGYITNFATAWISVFPEELNGFLTASLNLVGKDRGDHPTVEFFIMYQLAPDATQDEEPRGDEYIQVGGHADRMTVELREKTDYGYVLSTIGRSGASEEERTEVINIGENSIKVCPAEVLTAADAIPIFEHYFDHHSLPAGWHKRPWLWWNHDGEPLSEPPSEGSATSSIAAAASSTFEPQPNSENLWSTTGNTQTNSGVGTKDPGSDTTQLNL